MQIAGQMSSSENPSAHFLLAAEKLENSEESSLTVVFKASCPRGMLVLVVIARRKLNNSKWPLSKLSRAMTH
jgi:hypothetical protein